MTDRMPICIVRGRTAKRVAQHQRSKTRDHAVARAFSVVLVMLSLVACQSLSDVKPGDGMKLTIDGRSYVDIWNAALLVADEHFEIREQDQARGVILAERTRTFMEAPSWIGIFITPTASAVGRYTVEVVRRKWMTTNLNVQDWERKVLRDLEDVLAGRPMR